MNQTDAAKFEGWCVVEVFGHQKFAGYVSEQALGGASFVRVDVPECVGEPGDPPIPAFTKLFGDAAIYSISPVSEEFARAAAAWLRKRPVDIYMPALYPRETQQTPELMAGEDDAFDGDDGSDDIFSEDYRG